MLYLKAISFLLAGLLLGSYSLSAQQKAAHAGAKPAAASKAPPATTNTPAPVATPQTTAPPPDSEHPSSSSGSAVSPQGTALNLPALEIPANLERAMVIQGGASQPLPDRPQKVMFMKSEATDAKTAIADTLLTQVGMPLLTMGLSTQMSMWNPYMGETFAKAANLGKGVLLGHGSDTQGFEFDLLPGATAGLTLKPGPAEFLIPLSRYLASASTDLSAVQPVLLLLEQREKDKARLLSSRHVLLKQNKRGRFDLKPTIEREEMEVVQTMSQVTVRQNEGNVYSVITNGPLTPGEYALVFRKKSQTGQYTTNVALKLLTPPENEGNPAAGTVPAAAPSKSPFGVLRRPAASPSGQAAAQPEQQMTGFIAWDLRVLP